MQKAFNPSTFYRRWTLRAAMAFLLLLFLFAGLLLLFKTVPPPLDFLSETLEARLARALPGARLQIGAIRLDWPFWRIEPRIQITDLVLSDSDRPTLQPFRCDRVSFTLSISDLLRRRIAPRRVVLVRPRLDLAVAEHLPDLTTRPQGPGTFPATSIRVVEGLLLPRAEGAPVISLPEARLDMGPSEMRLTLSAAHSGETMDVDARRRTTGTGAARLDISFEGLRPAMLTALSESFTHLAGVRLPVKGRCFARQNSDGRLTRIDLRISGGAGLLSYPWLERDLPVQGASAEMEWRFPDPLFLTSCNIDFEGPSLHVTGPIGWKDGLPILNLTAEAADIDIADLSAYWPKPLEPKVRRWMTNHFISGNAASAKAQVWLTPEDLGRCRIPCNTLSATVDFSDVVLDYFPPMPPLRGASGRAVFSGCGVEIDVTEGFAADSRAAGGTVRILGFAEHPTRMIIDTQVIGPITDGFDAVSNLEPEGWTPIFQVTGGRADTRLRFDFPLQNDFDPGAFQVFVDARAEGLDIDTVWGIPLTNGNASIRYQNGELSAEGTAFSHGVPLAINWRSDLLRAPEDDMTLTATGAPGREAFASWGIPLPDFINGAMPATAELSVRNGRTRLEARFDLSRSRLEADFLGWEKPPGENATLALRLMWEDSGAVRLDQVHLYGTDFHVLGYGAFPAGASPALWHLGLKEIHLKANRLTADIRRTPDGYDAMVRGSLFNAIPLMERKRTPADLRTVDVPLDLRFEIDRILLQNGVELRQADGRFQRGPDGETSISLQGTTGPGEPVELVIIPVEKGQRLLAGAADAGTVVKGLGLYSHASDGRLTADFLIDFDARPWASGTLKITEFSVQEAPTLVNILSMASFDGVVRGLRQRGAAFDDLHVALSLDDGAATIKEGKMEGDALGVTFSGRYDMKRQEMDIEGIVVPFNLLNKAINVVPLVGKMITGKGIIAVSYALRGSPASPAIQVNPMSSLLVGRLRNLFDRFNPNGDPD